MARMAHWPYAAVKGGKRVEEEEEGEEDDIAAPARAPGRLRPAAASAGAALAVAALLGVTAAAKWVTDGQSRLRSTVLRRTEEAQLGGGAEPPCGSLPEFQRYANADTMGGIACSCPADQTKQLCEEGSRSQNVCCKPRVGSDAERGAEVVDQAATDEAPEDEQQEDEAPEPHDGAKDQKGDEKEEEEEQEEEEASEEGSRGNGLDSERGSKAQEGADCKPPTKSCTLLLSFPANVSTDAMDKLAAKYEREAKPSVMTALKIVSLGFGDGHASAAACCEAYKELYSDPAVASVEFDAPVHIAAAGQDGKGEPPAAGGGVAAR